jgi:hypothetical protein
MENVQSKIVFIRRVEKFYELHHSGDKQVGLWKIGASLNNNGPLRGLSLAEELIYLPPILGISASSEKFTEAARRYWNNISVNIPEDEGLKLETGWEWGTKADMDVESKLPLSERIKGRPINIADYILYRYALVYGRVANSFEERFATPKIRFYLHTKELEVKAAKQKIDVKNKAKAAYLEILGDRNTIKYILRVDDLSLNLDDLDNDDMDILLDELVEKNPTSFLKLCKDPDLDTKALLHEALRNNLLDRMPNSETVMMGSVVLGVNDREVVANLNSNADNFKAIRNKLEAELIGFIRPKTKAVKEKIS